MKNWLKKYLLTTLAVYLLLTLVPAISFSFAQGGLFSASLVLFFLLLIVRPILNFFLFPFNLLTLNFTAFLLYLFLIYFWFLLLAEKISFGAWNFPGLNLSFLQISPLTFSAWETKILSCLFLTFLIRFLEWLTN